MAISRKSSSKVCDRLRLSVQIVQPIDVTSKGALFADPSSADTGKWTLELSNTGGTAQAPFELAVRAAPAAPKGSTTLEPTHLRLDTCAPIKTTDARRRY